jgi:hypothetical protein
LEENIEQMAENVRYFSEKCWDKIRQWQRRVQRMSAEGKRVAIWGSGSKCVGFLTSLGLDDEIVCVVDINPHRHGKFIPGVGKPIMPPEHLKVVKPDVVIVMNAIYHDEIRRRLEKMEIIPEVISL